MRSIVNRTAGKLLVVIALVANQGCDRRAPTENHKLTPALTTPQADLSPGTLGKYQIPVPPENNRSNHGGGAPYTYTGIRIPAYTAYVITVNGRVSTTKNPAWYCQGTYSWPYDGHDYGPLGTGTNYDLLVNLRVWTFSGANAYVPVSLPGTGGASGPTEVKTDTLFTWYDQDLEAGRNGIAFACDDVGGYLMSGSQTLTVEEITNTLKLTPPEYYVHPGTRVTFTASMADGSPLGTTINWAWMADSLHARSVGGICGTNANPCSVTPTVSGTVRVVGNVLGKMREAKGHVTVYQNFTLESDSTSAHPLSNVRFTPKLDGKTAKAARWRWAPQDPTVQDNTTCTADTTCVKQMVTTGTMWAYLEMSGGDSASTAVTVLNPRLALQANPNPVPAAGGAVLFTALLDGDYASVARWSWKPDGAIAQVPPECMVGEAQCEKTITASGTMWATVQISPGQLDSASAYVSLGDGSCSASRVDTSTKMLPSAAPHYDCVPPEEEPTYRVVVNCTPTVTRGDNVHCVITLSPAAKFTITRWQSRTASQQILDQPVSVRDRGGSYDWFGPAVAATTVTVKAIKVEGAPDHVADGSGSFSVSERWGRPDWPSSDTPYSLPASEPADYPTLTTPYPSFVRAPNDHLTWKSRGIGASRWMYRPIRLRRVPTGPNSGILYTTTALMLNKDSTHLYHARSMDVGDPFYQIQTGGSAATGRYCEGADLTALRGAVIAHEQGHVVEQVAAWATPRINLENSYTVTNPALLHDDVEAIATKMLAELLQVYVVTPSFASNGKVDDPYGQYSVGSPDCVARWP